MELINKIYNKEKLNLNEIKAVKKIFTALDFITIEDNYRKLPTKILTTKGILNLVNDFETERDRASKLTGNYSASILDKFKNVWYMSRNSYELYCNSLITFLFMNKSILVEYLNLLHGLNLTLDDISKNKILSKSEIKISKKKINTLRNIKYEKDKQYIRIGKEILLLKDNKVYRLRGERNDNSSNIIKFKFRGSIKSNKNERNIRYAVTA